MLLCTTDPEAFTTLGTEIDAYNNNPCANLKTNIETKYCGESYKRHLEMKLDNLKIRSGTKLSEYLIIQDHGIIWHQRQENHMLNKYNTSSYRIKKYCGKTGDITKNCRDNLY